MKQKRRPIGRLCGSTRGDERIADRRGIGKFPLPALCCMQHGGDLGECGHPVLRMPPARVWLGKIYEDRVDGTPGVGNERIYVDDEVDRSREAKIGVALDERIPDHPAAAAFPLVDLPKRGEEVRTAGIATWVCCGEIEAPEPLLADDLESFGTVAFESTHDRDARCGGCGNEKGKSVCEEGEFVHDGPPADGIKS